MPKNEIRIGDGKAVIYANDYGVWQFRVWLADENKYLRKSLREKNREEAIRIATELWADVSYEKRRGKKFYGITVEEMIAEKEAAISRLQDDVAEMQACVDGLGEPLVTE